VTKHWNWIGVAIFLYYVGAAVYYFIVRATRTLNMGYLGYGVLVLLIEIVSSTATLGYAVLLIKYSKSRKTKGLPIPKKGEQPDLANLAFHVRVLVPCYKESVELVKLTCLGALKAPLPKNTVRTVYLCDDGKDPAKEEMLRELNLEWGCCEYVSGRKRDPNGEAGWGWGPAGAWAGAAQGRREGSAVRPALWPAGLATAPMHMTAAAHRHSSSPPAIN
jgi:cellulose synthase/poly-beta-1,6-N-acetylglucosamine synthase-like glycosyltransferase